MADKISIEKRFVEEKIGGKTTLFDVETSTFYSFNDTGSFIFSQIKKGQDDKKIAASLAGKYGIPTARAEKDVEDFFKDLLKNKIASSSKRKKQSK